MQHSPSRQSEEYARLRSFARLRGFARLRRHRVALSPKPATDVQEYVARAKNVTAV